MSKQIGTARIIIDCSLKHHFDDEMTTVPKEGEEPNGFDGLITIEGDLKTLLDKAQNPPPDGESDRTIGDLRYRTMRRLLNSLTALRRDYEEWVGLQ